MGNSTIGLVNLPALNPLLQEQGLRVVTGATFPDAAAAIRHHFRTVSQDMVLLVGDDATVPQQANSWLRAMCRHVPVVVVNLEGATGLAALDGLQTVLDTPAILEQVVDAVTDSQVRAPAATVGVDGSVTMEEQPAAPPTPQQPEAESDPWSLDFDDEPQTAAAVHAPAEPSTVPEAEEPDPWESEAVSQPNLPAAGVSEPASEPQVEVQDCRHEPMFTGLLEDDQDDEVDLESFDFDDLAPPPPPPPQQQQAATPAAAQSAVPEPLPTSQRPQPGWPQLPSPSTPHPVGNAAPEVGDTDDLTDLIVNQDAIRDRRVGTQERLGKVIFVTARKGGVGKSTTSTVLAQFAGDHGPDGFKVGLLDGNLGQGNIRGFLGLRRAAIPTILDAARSGNTVPSLLSPTTLNQYRHGRVPLSFGLVAGTTSDMTGGEAALLDPRFMRALIEDLRSRLDLLIIDTETIDEPDSTGLWDEVYLPMVRSGATLLWISDDSTESVEDTRLWLTRRAQASVIAPSQVLLLMNRIPEGLLDAINQVTSRMGNLGRHIGTIAADESIGNTQKDGYTVPSELDAYAPVAAAILQHVTSLAEFDPNLYLPQQRSFFGRLFGRGQR